MSTAKTAWLAENQREGEIYAGLLLGKNGEPDQHIFLLPGEAEGVNWAAAKEWAAKTGGDLPTRREQSLLFANCKEAFQPRWYWSGEQHAAYSSYAWYQDFSYGGLSNDGTSYEGRARAVRRLAIL
ncbi:DUF1566 domain-containing protein [Herbaspirillum sp. DW155]|uniref:DUF1566 domain-containing protein n=1 Tax=Herbaspirillum sp. DW155 TaxID=3095609 RepID=UPI003088D113|nr:DUF1566 domain-containing protein [Herbaspirillum sp. DW155]